jgi:hypothetical protein
MAQGDFDKPIVYGRGVSKMSPAERRRANAFWRLRLARSERVDRLYRCSAN